WSTWARLPNLTTTRTRTGWCAHRRRHAPRCTTWPHGSNRRRQAPGIRCKHMQRRIRLPDFTSHVLVVTGGSRGIGAAIVRQATFAGARVCFSYRRDRESAEALREELEVHGERILAIQSDAADVGSAP